MLGAKKPSQETLPLLFNLLDYHAWQDEVRPWQLLHRHLVDIFTTNRKQEMKCVASCWKERKSWWPSYHFRAEQVTAGLDSDMLTDRAGVACCLCGEENQFMKTVLKAEFLNEAQKQSLMDTISIIDQS